MSTILVTGAAGFIGSHTVDRLLATTGAKVVAVDNLSTGNLSNLRLAHGHSRMRFVRADICEDDVMLDLCRAHRPDAIIHLAGLVSVSRAEAEPQSNFSLNLEATHRVAEAARQTNVRRLVFASSAACYGESIFLPLREDQPATPMSMYGTAKLASETVLAGYATSYGIETVCLRYFNVYGERQDPNSPYSGVISRFAEAFSRKQPVTLYGNGTQTRDFIAVDDVACANVIGATANHIASGVRNVCTGQQRQLLDVLATFQKLYPESLLPQYHTARVGDIHASCGDPQRARRELGFTATVTLEQGLRKLISHNRKALLSA